MIDQRALPLHCRWSWRHVPTNRSYDKYLSFYKPIDINNQTLQNVISAPTGVNQEIMMTSSPLGHFISFSRMVGQYTLRMFSQNLALIQKQEKRLCMVKFLKHGKKETALTKLYILDVTAMKKLLQFVSWQACE